MGKPTRSLERKILQPVSNSALSYSTAIAACKGNFQELDRRDPVIH
jgi:hypothetical protein